ncbi:MAG: class II aldolase/adducin family protein [Rhodobacteraceae bacterium]|nr:class II aldolase/adducin family protein [Paracoccaceae bacterium]
MTTRHDLLSPEFRALSARLGQDPLQVQGPGGNTSIKGDGVMWIKASGTELADAETSDIFVAVDHEAARAKAYGAGDGSCKTTGLDPAVSLRPSIETTFHAALPHPVVAHTHSVATLTHAISLEGREAAAQKLAGLPFVMVPYAKPGLPLTREILARVTEETRIVILQNHGLIVFGPSVEAVSQMLADVEARLSLRPRPVTDVERPPSPEGFSWAPESWIAADEKAKRLALAGSYYPDHVVFLGPRLPSADHAGAPPAIVSEHGVQLRDGATSSQKAMLTCLSDVLRRLPEDWNVEAIGSTAEAELLNWDAEKYRQALAAGS